MAAIDEDFMRMVANLDKDHLLLLAAKAINVVHLVLDELRENEAGDAVEYHGTMHP